MRVVALCDAAYGLVVTDQTVGGALLTELDRIRTRVRITRVSGLFARITLRTRTTARPSHGGNDAERYRRNKWGPDVLAFRMELEGHSIVWHENRVVDLGAPSLCPGT